MVIPRNLSDPTAIPRNLLDPAAIPRTLSDPTAIPRNLSDPTAIPRNLSDPTAIPRNPADPAVIPRNLSDPAAILGNLSDPTAIPKNPSDPAAIPRNLLDPAAIPRNPLDPTVIPRNSSDPAALPAIPRNPSDPAALPAVPRNPSDPAALPRNPSDPAAIPAIPRKDLFPAAIPALDSDSHALNLLADLALGSWIPIPEHSRLAPTDPGHPESQTSGILRGSLRNPPREPRCVISDEHSYASPAPEEPEGSPDPRGNAEGGAGNAPAAPLVGRVLPFRRLRGGSREEAGKEEEEEEEEGAPGRRRAVSARGDSLEVTRRWEGAYALHLDSRYTSDALEKSVVRALHGPWDPDLPDDVEGMKLILHTWVALFYRKPSKLLSSSRKVVEHINPKKFVSINSSGAFPELGDDSQDSFGLETRPADSGWDPDQIPSSSLDPSSRSQAEKENPQAFPADSQTDADGIPGAVDSTVSSSSGELLCGDEEEEEEEPSSTSCPEGFSPPELSGEKPDAGRGEAEERARRGDGGDAEEPAKEELLDAGITPGLSEELGSPSKSPAENARSQTPNSSTASCSQESWEEQEKQQEKQQEAGSGLGPGPPEDEEGAGDSGRTLEVLDGADPEPGLRSLPLGANPGSAEPGAAAEEEEGCQEPSERSGREEEENEELEDEGSFQDPVDLVLSESSDAEMDRERNPASPEAFGVAEEEPASPASPVSPASPASPCPRSSSPVPSDTAGSRRGAFPAESTPDRDELPDPWDAPAAPEPDEAGRARGEPPFSPDSGADGPGRAGDAPGSGSEREEREWAPCGESWESARSTESPRGQGMSLALSPDSSSACLTSPDGSVDPWAAAEDRESVPESPARSRPGRRRLAGDEDDPDANSPGNEEPERGGDGFLGEEERGSPCAPGGVEELDDPTGAGDGRDSPLDYPDAGDERRAEESRDAFPEAEDSLGSDEDSLGSDGSHLGRDADVAEPETAGEFLPESEPSSSSVREFGISAIQELLPGQSFPNIQSSVPGVPGRRESVLCRLWKPCGDGAAARLSVAAWSPRDSLHPGLSREPIPSPAPRSPAEPGSAPPSPWDAWDDPEGAEPRSPLPEELPGPFPPSPDGSRWSRSCGSPGNAEEEPRPPEDPGPAPLPSWERVNEPWDAPEGCRPSPDPEAGEGEIPGSPAPASPWDERGDLGAERREPGDVPERLPNRDAPGGLEDPSGNSRRGSERGRFQGSRGSPRPCRDSCIVTPAGARTKRDGSSRSSARTEERREERRRERTENSRRPGRRGRRRCRESHLARSLLGSWRSSQGVTQNTLDTECLRFHYRLREILRRGRRPSSTSGSIFPTEPPRRPARARPSPRSRSPLRVTIPSSEPPPPRSGGRGRSRSRSREPGAAFRLGKLRCRRASPEPRRAVADILEEYSRLGKAVPAGPRAGRDPDPPGSPGSGGAGAAAALRGTVQELRGALRWRLRRVAAGARPGTFFLLETGTEPFFDRVKALLKARGFVRTDPRDFHGSQRLLVVVRNEDISSHIHTVPCLLELKRCPSVVFAGVDDPEEVTADTFQELFQAGGFVVSDEELLERVTLGQLKEVVKVLEELNRSGRWKWLLHHRESKKLRGDLRDDASAQRKRLLLRWCQGEELLEPLPFHACDAGARRLPCLLELQARRVHTRFAVFLTENPDSGSRELLESKGILVADVSTFLGTVQELAAPFRRSY